MDLSFPRCDRAAELAVWPGDLAVLMIGVAARQGASATACVQARLGAIAGVAAAVARADAHADGNAGPLCAPHDGAFNGRVATALARWREEGRCPGKE